MASFDLNPETCTLEDAREWLRNHVKDGADCPCCTQFAKVYRRKLNSSMARGLIELLRTEQYNGAPVPLHLPTIFREAKICGANDGALLRHWKLIEPEIGSVREDGSARVGRYYLTELGRNFGRGRAAVQKYAVLYNGDLKRLDGDSIGIRDALGSRFNYSELMKGI